MQLAYKFGESGRQVPFGSYPQANIPRGEYVLITFLPYSFVKACSCNSKDLIRICSS